MSPLYAKIAVVAAAVIMVAIRAPHGQISRSVPVRQSRRGRLELALLVVAWISFFAPLVWVVVPGPLAGDFALRPLPFALGLFTFALGLWLFHRSHADLGRNWSITLELREEHRLITEGVYRRIRHPMYSALLLYSVGQALVLPNWIFAPTYLVSMALLVALRLTDEEKMMSDAFGAEYREYQARTRRLVPGVY